MIRVILMTLFHGPLIALISLVLAIFLSILLIGVNVFIFKALAVSIEALIAVPLLIYVFQSIALIVSLIVCVLYWAQVARYAAAITGLLSLRQQPSMWAVFLPMTLISIACYVLAALIVVALALLALQIEGLEPPQIKGMMALIWDPSTKLANAWGAVGASPTERIADYAAILVAALLFVAWVMILIARGTGAHTPKNGYSVAMILLRVGYTLKMSLAIFLVWERTVSPIFVNWLSQATDPSLTFSVFFTAAGVISYWVALLAGFVLAFECHLLARQPAPKAPKRGPETGTGTDDIRDLRRRWQARQ